MSAFVQTVVGSDSPPIGAIMEFGGNVEPSGWLFCFGQAIPRTGIYAQLFDVIGTLHGAGDGSTTFNVPDIRGRIVAGRDDMGGTNSNRLSTLGASAITLGGVGGNQSHTLTAAEMPAHFHGYSKPTFVGATGVAAGSNYNLGDIGSNTDTRGGSAAHNNIQPTFIANKIIKYSTAGVVLPIVPGTGDVAGPASSLDGDLAVFDGTSGKFIKDGGRPSRVLIANANQVISSGTLENTIWTFTLPAGMLSRDGDSVRVTACFNVSSVSATKYLRIRFGSEIAYELSSTGTVSAVFMASTVIHRTSVTVQRAVTMRTGDNAAGWAEHNQLAQNLDGAVDVKIGVGSTVAGNSVHKTSMLEFLPVP